MEAPQSNVANLPGITPPAARGRVNPDQQEAAIDEKVVVAALPGLQRLYHEKQEASEAFNDAVKKAAGKAGVNSGPLKKLVVARSKEKTEELQREQEQLALMLFATSERE